MTATPGARAAGSDGTPSGAGPERDLDLLAQIAAGDERALGELYDRHGGVVFALAKAVTHARGDAEDVTAAVFAQLWRAAAQFDPARGTVATWLCTITRSRALDLLRSRKRREHAEEDAKHERDDGLALPLATPPHAPDADVELGEARALVTRSLADLPEPQRRVIELAYFGGLSQRDIAAALAEPLGTVQSRMRAAMEQLRRAVSPYVQAGRR